MIHTRARPQTPSRHETSEVLEVEPSTSKRHKAAAGHHSLARRGSSRAAAAQAMKPMVIMLPSAFFSSHSPRHAPGNSSCMRPNEGTNRQAKRLATARSPSAVAMISAIPAQRHRAARITPPRVVKTRATARLRVWSGLIDHSTEAPTTQSTRSKSGWRRKVLRISPGFIARSSTEQP